MVQLTLTNQHSQPTYKTAVIDIANGTCTLDDTTTMPLSQFMQDTAFEHPLIQRPYVPIHTVSFHYEYDNLATSFDIPILIYTTLLQSVAPHLCQFKISPSTQFQPTQFEKYIYLSIHHRTEAKKQISIRQLEAMIGQLNGDSFTFSEDLLMKESLTLKELPLQIDGDALFINDPALLEQLLSPPSLSRYELRYFNPTVGFGVFCKEDIKEGEVIAIYSGLKHFYFDNHQYAFDNQFDCLSLYTDARQLGNLARFVNHAPSPARNDAEHADTPFLAANLVANNRSISGMRVLLYTAMRDIEKGEQLLISYGDHFPTDPFGIRFTKQNKIVYTDKSRRHSSGHKLAQIKTMATHGVHAAQQYLIIRWIGIIVLFVILEQMGLFMLHAGG